MYRFTDLMLCFFVFGFLGWCAEAVILSIREGRFVNRGFLMGPIVPLYGACAAILSAFFEPWRNNIVWLCIASMVLFGIMEFMTGFILERHFHAKWWDYSDRKHNIRGYICLEHVAIKGASIALLVKYCQPLMQKLLSPVPELLIRVVVIALWIVLGIDLVISYCAARKLNRDFTKAEWLARLLRKITQTLGLSIADVILRRGKGHMEKAFPKMHKQEEEAPTVFASGLNRYKLFWIFFITALAGDIIETIFVYATSGKLMSRSSLLYGPFSVVWGLGGVLLTVILQGLAQKNDRYVFLGGFLIGSIYEYACSVLTEICFGTVFWDYSKLPFNINGRINLLFCVFWGVLALIWIKNIYPIISAWIERIPVRLGKPLTVVLAIALLADGILSVAALARMDARAKGNEQSNAIEAFLDETYPDDYLKNRYQNMKFVVDKDE